MKAQFGRSMLELTIGDLARERTDALVTAANEQLAGGGGVDGAIHRAAGPAVLAELKQRYPEGCPTGSAVATSPGTLPVRLLIHAVGPIWRGGRAGEAEQLRSAYTSALELAVAGGCASVSFPSIGTGSYAYPVDLASEVAIGALESWLVRFAGTLQVRLVLFDPASYGAYGRVLEEKLQ